METLSWLRLVYSGDVWGGTSGARPALAARIFAEQAALVETDAYLACAVGDEQRVRESIAADPGWVAFAAALLEAGADPRAQDGDGLGAFAFATTMRR